ncbi:MAG: SPOC like C-terminal domain-containing protein [Monoraphidium minutum]|nr:MAG: SPOC like C-terminal domain-containing protein [Monoraphidium minutum]
MTSVGKELHLVVLDVGPDMHPYAAEVACNLFNLATTRVLNKPVIEMALIYYGTTETDNELNREMLAAGEAGQYTNLVVAHELACVSQGLMAALAGDRVPRGGGPSDWINAVLLALDMMIKADKKFNLSKWPRKLTLISTFTQAAELDAEFRKQVVESLRRTRLSLEVVVVGEEPWGAPGGGRGEGKRLSREVQDKIAARDANLESLTELLSDVTGSIREAPRPGDAAGIFQVVHKEGNAAYSGPLTMGTTHINVKIYKKTNPEPVTYNSSAWELKRYCKPREHQPDDECWVGTSREMRVVGDMEGSLVEAPDTLGAYRYGRQRVPITPEEEGLLAYHPDKGVSLLGFVDAQGEGAVPQWYLGCSQTKGCFVVLGSKEADAAALSALAHGMAKEGRAAVVRGVLRKNSPPALYLLTPLLAPPRSDQTQPQARARGRGRGFARMHCDCLVMNRLPFADDFRSVVLPTFDAVERKEVQPSAEQMKAMHAVVDACDLSRAGPGGREALRPEDCVNPAQQRLYTLVGRRALDEGYKFEGDEGAALLQAVAGPPLDRFPPKARGALEKLPQLFKTQAPKSKQAGLDAAAAAAAAAAAGAEGLGEGGGGDGVLRTGEGGTRLVREVGTASPLEDFDALLGAGREEDALRGMEDVILRLVEESVAGLLYPKASDCLARLRAACVALPRPGRFNDLLGRLMERFEGDPLHGAFAARLLAARVAPISSDEVPAGAEGAVTPAQAEAFLARGRGAHAAAPTPAREEEEDDELAGME